MRLPCCLLSRISALRVDTAMRDGGAQSGVPARSAAGGRRQWLWLGGMALLCAHGDAATPMRLGGCVGVRMRRGATWKVEGGAVRCGAVRSESKSDRACGLEGSRWKERPPQRPVRLPRLLPSVSAKLASESLMVPRHQRCNRRAQTAATLPIEQLEAIEARPANARQIDFASRVVVVEERATRTT